MMYFDKEVKNRSSCPVLMKDHVDHLTTPLDKSYYETLSINVSETDWDLNSFFDDINEVNKSKNNNKDGEQIDDENSILSSSPLDHVDELDLSTSVNSPGNEKHHKLALIDVINLGKTKKKT